MVAEEMPQVQVVNRALAVVVVLPRKGLSMLPILVQPRRFPSVQVARREPGAQAQTAYRAALEVLLHLAHASTLTAAAAAR